MIGFAAAAAGIWLHGDGGWLRLKRSWIDIYIGTSRIGTSLLVWLGSVLHGRNGHF